MREHEQFGRPLNLRPRSAGVNSVASPRAVAPEQLASEATRSNAAATLSERLQMPRPGSATAALRRPCASGVPVVATVPPVEANLPTPLQPTLLLSKPPMRPRSALLGSRGVVSHHRMELLRGQRVVTKTRSDDNQTGEDTRHGTAETHIQHQGMTRDLAPQLRRAVCRSEKADDIQPASATTATGHLASTKRPFKRPFSAAPSVPTPLKGAITPEEVLRTNVGSGTMQKSSQHLYHLVPEASQPPTSRGKRPFSAAPAFGGSRPRHSVLQSTSHVHSPVTSDKKDCAETRIQSAHVSRGALSIMSSFQRDTFVYAVPRHCLERDRQYNPYDIVTISHEALFGSNLSTRATLEARCDFYTISATGMTFHCKDDNFEPTFLTSAEWERQRTHFLRICRLPTFQMFRYRKVFISWKKWVRSMKIESARIAMQSSLYFAQPFLSQGMKAIRDELAKLDEVNLMCDLEGKTVHLSYLSAKNRDHVQNQGMEILKITGRIQQILLQVCRECLGSTENPYGGFPGHEFAMSRRKSSNFQIFEAFVERERALATANHQLVQHHHFQTSGSIQPSRVSLSTAGQLRTTQRKYMARVIRAQQQRPQDTLEEIRWTLASIQRRRCLSLAKFVSLVDLMLLDALHSVLLQSIQRLRDSLWVGSNAVPISKLIDRRDYVLAFHKTMRQGSPDPSPPSGRMTTDPESHPITVLLNKQQIKRFLRTTWEAKFPGVLRASQQNGKPEDSDDSQQLKSSAAVWLGSRLDAFFSQALRDTSGNNTELFSIDEIMHIVEQLLARALVLPEFDASLCSIIMDPTREETREGSSPVDEDVASHLKALQQIKCLEPIALLHMGMMLRVEERTKQCEIVFKPSLDQVPILIQELLSDFVEVFRSIPSIVLHQEIRAVLEFAEDFQAPTLVVGADDRENGPRPLVEDDSEGESCWHKSNYDRLFARIGNDHECLMVRVNIDELQRSATAGAEAFARSYDRLLAAYTRNQTIDFATFQTRFRSGDYSLKEMEADARAFNAEIHMLRHLKVSQRIEFLEVNMAQLSEALSPSSARCLQQLHTLYPVLALEKCEAFLAYVREACAKIEKPLAVSNLDAFARYLLQLRDVQDEIHDKEFDLTFVHDMFAMFTRLEIVIPANVGETFDLCEPEFEALKSQLNESMARRDADILERSPLLTETINKLKVAIENLKTNSADKTINAADCVSSDARIRASDLEKESEALTQQSIQLVWIQRVFREFAQGSRPPVNDFVDLQVVSSELRLKNELWESVNDAEAYLDTKRDETIRGIDLGQLRNILARVDTVIKRVQQQALQIAAVKRLENSKLVLEGLSPVIRDLRNEHFEERHWTKLEHKLSCSFRCTIELTSDVSTGHSEYREVKFLDLPLRHLLEIEAVSHASVIHQVAEEATAEAAIGKSFQSVAHTWEAREIPSFPKKDRDGRDVVCLGECTEILTLLEESEVLLRVMESSSFARVIYAKLAKLLQDLAHTKESMELLVVCQQKREHLQRLVSVDFVRSFPEQSKQLQMHDANWKAIMDGIAKRPLCVPFGTNTEHRQLLQATLQGFEVASQYVEQHLGMKRELFPGFFKLSNTELAALLSKLRDANTVQQFLYQCFDNVGRINFGTREACQDVLSVTSRSFPQAEIILMGKNLKARGPPEQWLVGIERRLVEMLRKATKEAVSLVTQASESSTTTLDLATVRGLPLQCILLADRILRSELIDSTLLGSDGSASLGSFSLAAQNNLSGKLRQFHAAITERIVGTNLQDASAMVQMSPREIMLLSSLHLHEIEFQDAIGEHSVAVADPTVISGNRARGHGVHWQLQLKHRFDDSTTVGYDCHVEIGGVRVPYGFNYVNMNAEVVFTPRSMRFVFSVFAATRQGHAALLTGCRGAGKQTVALQVSRLFGRRYFGIVVSEMPAAAQYLCQVAHCLKLVRGALLAGGVLCIGLPMEDHVVNLFRVLGSTVAKIQHSVLCKLPITGLQKDPITWIPGTTLLFTCTDQSSPSHPRWSTLQHTLSAATTSFARIAVVAEHDIVVVLEALVFSKQLEAPQRTARKLDGLWSHFRSLNLLGHRLFTLQTAKHIVATVAADMWQNSEPFEREHLQSWLICEAVVSLCTPLFVIDPPAGETARSCVVKALNEFFHYAIHEGEWYTRQWRRHKSSSIESETKTFEEAIDDAAQELHYVPRRQLVKKSLEVVKGFATHVGVVMVGPSGVGKSTMCAVLSQALGKLKYALVTESQAQITAAQPSTASVESSGAATITKPCDGPSSPFVKVCVMLPLSLTLSQLFGSTTSDAKGQVKSLLGRLIREAQECFSLSTDHEIQCSFTLGTAGLGLESLLAMQKLMWVVFDGGSVCGGVWLDALVAILSRKYKFGLLDTCASPSRELVPFSDGEFMTIPPNLRFVFETWNLENATPAVLEHCGMVVFPPEDGIGIERDDGGDLSIPVHFACIQHFLEQQRFAATFALDGTALSPVSTNISASVYDTIADRLLGTNILVKIFAVMEDYGVAIHISLIHRVEYMLAMLQALLSTVAASCSASRNAEDNSTTTLTSAEIPLEDVHHRVEMATVYALLWGFSTCCAHGFDDSRSRALQLLISGMLKTQFDCISHTWEDCGRDANLFELLLDLNGLRFVSLDSGDANVLRDKLRRHALSSHASVRQSNNPPDVTMFHTLFVPTQSSLIVHAAMKEAIRSARGVLLVGSDTSRKTTLLQNFLKQLESVRVLTTSNYASIPVPMTTASGDAAGTSVAKRKRGVALLRAPLLPHADSAYAPLDRIRLHQIGLVKRLAKRFRKVNKAAAAVAALAAAQRYGSSKGKSTSENQPNDKPAKAPKKPTLWALRPHLETSKTDMVSQFDHGDFIPFYFAMNQHDRGVDELAKCLERMLQRERSGIFEPPPGKTAVLILDDLHLPVAQHDEQHPSCHEYLRSAYEHSTVWSNNVEDVGARPITIENLMMVASISSRAMVTGQRISDVPDESPLSTRHASLGKLTKRFFPVYAPPCSLLELHTIFHTVMVAHWERQVAPPVDKLPSVVRQTLPVIVAAATVLWERLRRRRLSRMATATSGIQHHVSAFNLHDLMSVYAGMCAVEPSYIMDSETMARLWAHETTKSFGDCSLPGWKAVLTSDVFRVRILLDGLENQTYANSSSTSATPTISASTSATKVSTTIGSTAISPRDDDATRRTNLHTKTSPIRLLSFFSKELLDTAAGKKAGTELVISPQQRTTFERKKLHEVPMWAFVPSSLYYQTNHRGNSSNATAEVGSHLQRRNSIRFIRRKSQESMQDTAPATAAALAFSSSSRSASLGKVRWIYAELPVLEDGELGLEDGALQVAHNVFSAIRVFGAVPTGAIFTKPVTDLLLQTMAGQVPRGAPTVTLLLARSISTLERVVTPPGSRSVVIGPPGSARELLVRYACDVRQSSQSHTIWTVEGVADAEIMAKKWKHVVSQLFQRVGVDYESVTLIVRRLPLWPQHLISQLLALMVSGEIPGAFSLEEQIRLATRVRDERLLDLEQRYHAQVACIRQEVEMEKEQEAKLAKCDEAETAIATKKSMASQHQDIERKYQHELLIRLSQVQLRHQQELDDFLRTCEVENESVTATIMSLMRPLGTTSGKWQQIVQRMRKRLRIMVLVDSDERSAVETHAPRLLGVGGVASLSRLDGPSLQTLLYGSFRSEVQNAFRLELARFSERADGIRSDGDERGQLLQFQDRVEYELPKIVAVATEMHATARALAKEENRKIPTELAVSVARFFARLLRRYYQKERGERRKTDWFTYVYESMETSLWKLQDQDGQLREQLASCDQQIEVSQELLTEQRDDCDRIRDMMKRYQEAADDQVQITNEMELRAQAELHVPMACLEEANAALLLIDKRHIIEIKSFNSPPLLVHLVLDAICVLFQLEPAWENARKILSDANVVHTLMAFDKDHISDEIITKLESTYISDPRFNREEVEKQSVAASMMVVWVRAMYQYATARRQVLPTLEKLEQAQTRLRMLMQEFQVSKQRVVDADDALATTKATLEKAHELRRQTVDDMESRKSRLDGGRVVLECLAEDKQAIDRTTRQLDEEAKHGLAWWNALLTAGALAYSSFFDASDRVRLYEQWAQAHSRTVRLDCSQEDGSEAGVAIEFNFVPAIAMITNEKPASEPAPSSNPNQSSRDPMTLFNRRYDYWQFASACGYLFSARHLQDAFLLTQTACAGFPVVLVTSYASEMEELLVRCARHVWRWTQFFMVSATAPDLLTIIATAVKDGHQLLILDVDPLDVEFKFGRLWSLFHWHQATVAANAESSQTVDHLILTTDEGGVATTDAAADPGDGSGKNHQSTIPIHPGFRAVLSTYQDAKAFGDNLLTRVPVISARLYTSEIADILLDRMWHPGLFEGGQHGFGLKQSVRDYERLRRQQDESETQLTMLIQGAAVRGQFQVEESELIRAACKKTKDMRESIAQKHREIDERLNTVEKHKRLARLGASIFSGLNCGHQERLSLQVFLPVFLSALKKPPAVTHAPTRLESVRGQALNQRGPSQLSLLIEQQQGSAMSLGFSSSKGTGFDTIGEIVRKMHQQLMPLVRDVNEWYQFVLHMLWMFERQSPVEGPAVPEVTVESLDEAASGSGNVPRVRRVLSMMKISHWTSHTQCRDYKVLPLDFDDRTRLVSLVVNGPSAAAEARVEAGTMGALDVFSGVVAASRCRAERVKAAVSMYPELTSSLCDSILQQYGVHVRFTACDLDNQTPSVSRGTFSPTNATIRDLLGDRHEQHSPNNVRSGWLRMCDGLPVTACVVVQSVHAFDSFEFLRRVFFSTVPPGDSSRADLLQAALGRCFRSSSDLDEVFLLPNQRLLSSNTGSDRGSALSLMGEQAFMVRDVSALLEQEQSSLDAFLDDVPLAILNFQDVDDSEKVKAYWEDLFDTINCSPDRTTSVELRRFESVSGSRHKGTTGTAIQSETGKGPLATPDALVSLSASTRGPTARRFSTHSLQHRRSDASSLMKASTSTSFVTVVDTMASSSIPPHLRGIEVAFAAEASELGSNRVPSFKRSLQEAVVRVAFHPCGDLFRQLVVTNGTDSAAKTQSDGSAANDSAAQEATALGVLMWQHLTMLIVYHAMLAFRWQLTLRQYKTDRSAELSLGRYSMDVLTTAVDQLLYICLQMRSPNKSSTTQSFKQRLELLQLRIRQQVFITNYSRQATARHEAAVVRVLCHDILSLIPESSRVRTDHGNDVSTVHPSLLGHTAHPPGISHGRSVRSYRVLQVMNASTSLPGATHATATPPAQGALSRGPSVRRAASDTSSQQLLVGLNMPLDKLESVCQDAASWIDTMWIYAESVDISVESLVRDTFGLLSPVETELTPHRNTCDDMPSWMELFGWIKYPVQYGSVAAQISLNEALHFLEVIHERIVPPVFDLGQGEGARTGDSQTTRTEQRVGREDEDEGDNESESESESGSEGEIGRNNRDTGDHHDLTTISATVATKSSASLLPVSADGQQSSRAEKDDTVTSAGFTQISPTEKLPTTILLEHQIFESWCSGYNTHVRALQAMLRQSIDGLRFWRGQQVDRGDHGCEQALASVANQELLDMVLASVCDQVPTVLRTQVAASPTYLLASASVSLDTLVAHYHYTYRNLQQHYQQLQQRVTHPGSSAVSVVEWWLPGIPARIGISHLLALARRSLPCIEDAKPSLASHGEDLVFSLLVEPERPDKADSESAGETDLGYPDGTIAVLSGLELRLAVWDSERGYLQPLDRNSARVLHRVKIVCQFMKGPPPQAPVGSGTRATLQNSAQRQRPTRSCPLLLRDSVAYEFELPVGPAVGPLVAPYLTIGLP